VDFQGVGGLLRFAVTAAQMTLAADDEGVDGGFGLQG